MSEWFENREFWLRCRDLMFDEESVVCAPDEVVWIIERIGLERPAHVLDLCCGPGRHAAAFRTHGFDVTGVDLEPTYLDDARNHAPGLEAVQADMRAFRREGAFDLAVNLYTSFGYFEDPDDDRRVIENVFASLKPGGTLVVEMKGKESLARVFEPISAMELGDGSLLVAQRSIEGDWEFCRTTWTRFRGGEREEFTFCTRLYSAVEFRRLLAEAGFERIEFAGDLAGSPLDHKANRLVALARRPR
ncbi:MAG: class I SAM-dependent methyltransferase [Planctomycetota bacterium]|jgi:SAM-dependent methyltransferase